MLEDDLEEWRVRTDAFLELAPLPRWFRGVVVDEEMRDHYERYLPIDLYVPVLRQALLRVLPDEGWLPQILQIGGRLRSVCDLWSLLPDRWSHRLVWEVDECWAVACALAAPARFGTRAERYPEQRDVINAGDFKRILDLGCGTGQGTWEIAEIVGAGAVVTGVTLEPLEVWMAGRQQLPHLESSGLDAGYPNGGHHEPRFIASDIRAYASPERCDLIVCNGLVGGPALNRKPELLAFWATVERAADLGCALIVGNHFHGGFADANARLIALAPEGWLNCAAGVDTVVFRRN